MSLFELYFNLGLQHIADLKGYDHILFILTLCAVYSLQDWKRILLLVTAFTIGHSLTLVLATLNLLRINTDLIEFLIPLTIFLTALANVLARNARVSPLLHILKYAAALFFGLIHGLGFSSYLRSLLGSEKGLALPVTPVTRSSGSLIPNPCWKPTMRFVRITKAVTFACWFLGDMLADTPRLLKLSITKLSGSIA